MLRPNHVIMQHSCSVYDVRFRPNHASCPSTKSKSNPSYHSFKTRPDPAGRPGTRLTRGWNRAGFKEKSARDLARKNLVDPKG
jgi:hypothetical protein